MKAILLATCMVLALGCSGSKDPCAGGVKVEVVKLPAWFEFEDVGTMAFEAGKKPVFTPKPGAARAERFQQVFDEEMKGDGTIGLRFEEVEGSTRHFCGAAYHPGQPEYPMAAVYYFAYERGDYKYTKLDKAPAPAE